MSSFLQPAPGSQIAGTSRKQHHGKIGRARSPSFDGLLDARDPGNRAAAGKGAFCLPSPCVFFAAVRTISAHY